MHNNEDILSNINNQLLTTLVSPPITNDFNTFKLNFYFFSYAETHKNEFFNHLAFTQLELFFLKLRIDKNIPAVENVHYIFGLLLMKYHHWGYLNIDLKKTLAKLDQGCESFFSKSISHQHLIPFTLYLNERHRLTANINSEISHHLESVTERTITKILNTNFTTPCNSIIAKQLHNFVNYLDVLYLKFPSLIQILHDKSAFLSNSVLNTSSLKNFTRKVPKTEGSIPLSDNLDITYLANKGLNILFKENTTLFDQNRILQILNH